MIEMIVVIAIITIISVIVAPKFIDYVEKARKGTDDNTLWEVAHAAEVAYINCGKNEADTELQVRIDSYGNADYVNPQLVEENTLTESVNKVIAADSYVYKSKTYRGSTVIITINPNTGKATVGGASLNKDYTQVKVQIDELLLGFIPIKVDTTLGELADKAATLFQGSGLDETQKEQFNKAMYEAEVKGETLVDTVTDVVKEILKGNK